MCRLVTSITTVLEEIIDIRRRDQNMLRWLRQFQHRELTHQSLIQLAEMLVPSLHIPLLLIHHNLNNIFCIRLRTSLTLVLTYRSLQDPDIEHRHFLSGLFMNTWSMWDSGEIEYALSLVDEWLLVAFTVSVTKLLGLFVFCFAVLKMFGELR